MMDLDLNLLSSLAALLQTRSVSQAAKRRRMSQPAMSRSLAELRRRFGDPLLVRTRGGMMLTRRAEELAEPLRAWIAEAERLVAPPTVDPATLTRRFRVAAGEYEAHSVLSPALPRIAASAPGVAFDVTPMMADAAARLAGGEIDLAIGPAEPDRRLVHERHLCSEPYLCLARAGHPLALQAMDGPPAPDDLLLWPRVDLSGGEDAADPVVRATGRRGRVIASLPYAPAALDLLAATDAVIVLPAGAARELARDGRLCLFDAPPELGRHDKWLTWHTRGHRDPALQWLIACLAGGCPHEEPLLQAAE